MNLDNLPATETEQYNPNLEAQDEDVASGGSNRLMYVLVALVLALVLGYVALPKGGSSGLAAATPSFMLDDAAVTAKVPASTANTAADPKEADPATKEEGAATDEENTKPAAKAVVAARPTPAAAAVPVAAEALAPLPAAPEPAAASAAPEPVAPANGTVSGRIVDENGRALVGATVLLKGSSKGTSTDANGNYTMEVPGGNNTLIYGYGGYEDEVMSVSGTKPVNVTLTPRAKAGKRRR